MRLLKDRLRRRDERGYAAVIVGLCVVTIILPLCALAVDVGRMLVEAERLQSAADAAATAGVTFLPDDFASARATALDVASRNGFPHGGSVVVEVTVGIKPTQLKVRISSRIRNAFAASFGAGQGTVSRVAVADYNGPAPMGSPCNTFGNEPNGTTQAGPEASQLTVAAGGATCSRTPKLWAAIAGPQTGKGRGDQYMTRTCDVGNSGCVGTVNQEFDPDGYFYVVRATAAAVGSTVKLQIYDPAFVEQGDNCDAAPTGTVDNDNWNFYADDDARARYFKAGSTTTPSPHGASEFCTGDVSNGGTEAVVTSFGLRSPTDTYEPLNAPAILGCGKQYPGYLKNEVTAATLRQGNAAYNVNLARVFRQWSTLCTFTVTQAGDYYLQVRTNVKKSTGTLGPDGAYADNRVFTQTGDDTSVQSSGNNRFAMRVSGAPAGSMSISGRQAMSVFMNYSGSVAEFNLVRVIPAAQGKSLVISFFDVGDASQPGDIQIMPPTDSNLPAAIQGCTGTGPKSGAIPACKLTSVSSANGYNGKTQVVTVPIPNTYSCTVAQAGGCWFRIQFSFTGSVPQDTTTWSAKVEGDPVRLIE